MDKFIKLYSGYLTQSNKDKRVTPAKEELLKYQLNFTMTNQMGLWTSQYSGVWFCNTYEVVFGHLRLHLMEHNKTAYNSINWEQSANKIIEDLAKGN